MADRWNGIKSIGMKRWKHEIIDNAIKTTQYNIPRIPGCGKGRHWISIEKAGKQMYMSGTWSGGGGGGVREEGSILNHCNTLCSVGRR
jgi:hypothetical protein